MCATAFSWLEFSRTPGGNELIKDIEIEAPTISTQIPSFFLNSFYGIT
jgi:hypothetical protein